VIAESTVAGVLAEFEGLIELSRVLEEEGVGEAVRYMERASSPEEARRLSRFLESHRRDLPFAFGSRDEADRLLSLLEAEEPQTVAVVLARLMPSKAAAVLERIAPERRVDILRKLAALQGTHDEVIRRLEARLRGVLGGGPLFVAAGEARDGIDVAADIVRAAGPRGRGLIEELRAADRELARRVGRRLFAFDDLPVLDEPSLRRVLEEVDRSALGVAAAAASPKARSRILSRLPRKAARALQKRGRLRSPTTLAEIEAARRSVVEVALRLEDAGEIRIPGVSVAER
jgi:flagellar motor switch protein FliG